MIKNIKNLLILLSFSFPLFSQVHPDSTNFIAPVKHPIKLAGSFAELRSNHFHSGIDIKTSNGEVGDPIIAIENGKVSRIKIESSGYGRALYIDHPNGYTSVYAHLKSFNPTLENFVRSLQRQLQTFSLDIYLDDQTFDINKGEEIGEIGNTGRSSAPHLHFEIRETTSEKPVLPSLFKIDAVDDVAPVVSELYLYALEEDGKVVSKQRVALEKNSEGYKSNPLIINNQSPYFGFGMVSYDRSTGVWNKNGIYRLQVSSQDSNYFDVSFDQLDFSESKAINAIIDYPHYASTKTRIIKLFNSECNLLSNYNESDGQGIFKASNNKTQVIELMVYDAYGNQSRISTGVKTEEIEEYSSTNDGISISCSISDSIVLSTGTEIIFKENSFYADADLLISEAPSPYEIKITHQGPPTHRTFKLKVKSLEGINALVKKEEGKFINFGGKKVGDFFIAALDEFGTYQGMIDDEAPTIEKVATISTGGSKKYHFHVRDNIDYDGSLGDYYVATDACGDWILYTFDKKSDHIIIDSSEIATDCNDLKLTIADHSGNVASYTFKL